MDFQIFLKNRKFISKFLIVFLIFNFLFLILASEVSAQKASLYLSPSTGTYTVGNTFLVQLKVNSGGVAINAADSALVFDPNDLEVRSLSKEGSIFTLWVQEPIFSNSLGTINFAGGKPSPGFTGAAGIIINITFKAKTAGTTNVTFASGSVLADDGKGTNILANMGSGSYRLVGREITPLPPAEEEYVPPVTPGQPPAASVISSPTYPEENKWYSNNDPEFSWKLPSGVTKVSYGIDQNPTTNPEFIAEGLITEVSFSNLDDGIWYFHINFRNQSGWGKITHRKVLIDTQPPKPFKIIFDNQGDPINPRPLFNFKTIDSLSGVEYYEVIFEQEGGPTTTTTTPQDIKDNPYQSLPLPPGKHKIIVKAFDGAGNFSQASTEFEILPIETPIITKYPKRLNVGEKAVLEGKSLPEVTILVFIREKGKEPMMEETKADGEGNWAFTSQSLEKGGYEVWVRAKDEREALSLPSPRVSFEVGLPPLLKFGTIAIGYLTIMSTLIVLIVVALGIIFYAWYRISLWRKKLRKETQEVTQSVIQAFRALREEVQEQIEYLDKKPGLTRGEKEVRDKLQEALNVSEEFISKEIKDLEKELE